MRRSVLSPGVRVGRGATVEGSVLLDGVEVGEGAVVRRAIIDKEVTVPPGAVIGQDPQLEARRFTVSDHGDRGDRQAPGRRAARLMRVGILTREYPPEVYGGAGVHVEHLTQELARHVEVAVHCFGEPRSSPLVAAAYRPWDGRSREGAPRTRRWR